MVAVDDLEERDVVVLLPVEGDDQEEILVLVALLALGADRLLHVHCRAESLDGLGGDLPVQLARGDGSGSGGADGTVEVKFLIEVRR